LTSTNNSRRHLGHGTHLLPNRAQQQNATHQLGKEADSLTKSENSPGLEGVTHTISNRCSVGNRYLATETGRLPREIFTDLGDSRDPTEGV
jgi:hypothetical protein